MLDKLSDITVCQNPFTGFWYIIKGEGLISVKEYPTRHSALDNVLSNKIVYTI